jgi:Spy/CpxP family protein refolding chaperone
VVEEVEDVQVVEVTAFRLDLLDVLDIPDYLDTRCSNASNRLRLTLSLTPPRSCTSGDVGNRERSNGALQLRAQSRVIEIATRGHGQPNTNHTNKSTNGSMHDRAFSRRESFDCIRVIRIQLSVARPPRAGPAIRTDVAASAFQNVLVQLMPRRGSDGKNQRIIEHGSRAAGRTTKFIRRSRTMKNHRLPRLAAVGAALAIGLFASTVDAQGRPQGDDRRGERAERFDPAQRLDRRVSFLTEQLQLTSSQQTQIRSILSEEMTAMQTLRPQGDRGERGAQDIKRDSTRAQGQARRGERRPEADARLTVSGR